MHGLVCRGAVRLHESCHHAMLGHQLALKGRSSSICVAQVGRSVTCTNFTATASATVAGEHLLVHRVARPAAVQGFIGYPQVACRAA